MSKKDLAERNKRLKKVGDALDAELTKNAVNGFTATIRVEENVWAVVDVSRYYVNADGIVVDRKVQ